MIPHKAVANWSVVVIWQPVYSVWGHGLPVQGARVLLLANAARLSARAKICDEISEDGVKSS
jgi:hypothetical protein